MGALISIIFSTPVLVNYKLLSCGLKVETEEKKNINKLESNYFKN